MTLTEHTMTIYGKPVHYWEAGSSHTRSLLLLHSLADAQSNWTDTMAVLAEQFHVFAPDLPGFGASAPLTGGVDAWLMWLKQLITGLEQEQMALVGHSFGALLVRLFSAVYPQYVPAAILVNGGTLPNVPNSVRWIGRLPIIGSSVFRGVARSTLAASLAHDTNPLPVAFTTQAQANIAGFASLMRLLATNPIPETHTPPVPTLLLWGASDTISTPAEAERIKSAIPGAQLSLIADCGHLPHIEASDVFAWQIIQFLDNLNRPTKSSLPGVGRLRG